LSLAQSVIKRPLNSLTVEEVKSLLSNTDLEFFHVAVTESQIDGKTLSDCHSIQRLKTELKIESKTEKLFADIQKYAIEMVPISLLVAKGAMKKITFLTPCYNIYITSLYIFNHIVDKTK